MTRTERTHQRTPYGPQLDLAPSVGFSRSAGGGGANCCPPIVSDPSPPAQMVAEQTLKSRELCDRSRCPDTSQGGFVASYQPFCSHLGSVYGNRLLQSEPQDRLSHTCALSPGLRSLNIQPARAVIPQRFLLEICPEGRGVELTDLCVQMPGGSSGDRLFLGRELLPESLQWKSHLPSGEIGGSRAPPCGRQEHSAKLRGPQG